MFGDVSGIFGGMFGVDVGGMFGGFRGEIGETYKKNNGLKICFKHI